MEFSASFVGVVVPWWSRELFCPTTTYCNLFAGNGSSPQTTVVLGRNATTMGLPECRSFPSAVSHGSTDSEVNQAQSGVVHLHPTFRVGRRELNLEAPNLNCARVVNDIFNAFSTTALTANQPGSQKPVKPKVVLFLSSATLSIVTSTMVARDLHDFESLKLVDKPECDANTHDLPQTLRGSEGRTT